MLLRIHKPLAIYSSSSILNNIVDESNTSWCNNMTARSALTRVMWVLRGGGRGGLLDLELSVCVFVCL
jgi:hypothetical protein